MDTFHYNIYEFYFNHSILLLSLADVGEVAIVAVAVKVDASISLINSNSHACSFSRREAW